MNYTDRLIPMDIIIVYNPKSILHKLIYKVTGYRAGHVSLYVGDGMIYEARSTGIKRIPCRGYAEKARIYIARVLDITENQELQIRRFCFDSENKNYAYLQLIAMLFKYTFKLSHVPDVSKKAMICSEFVENAFLAADIVLVKKYPWEVVPADILNSDKVWLIECK